MPGQEAERHALGAQLHRPVGRAGVRQVVARVRVADVAGGRVDHEVEAGDEHLLRDVRAEEVVDALEHLARRDDPLAGGAQQAPGRRHHHRGRDALVGDVADDHRDLPVGQLEEVVEVAADLAGRLVVRRHLPAGKVGQHAREEVLLDQRRDLELLLDPLARPRLCRLLLHELRDLESRGGLRREPVEEALVVGRVLLVGEPRPEVERADELAAADQRHDERDAGLAECRDAGRLELEALDVDRSARALEVRDEWVVRRDLDARCLDGRDRGGDLLGRLGRLRGATSAGDLAPGLCKCSHLTVLCRASASRDRYGFRASAGIVEPERGGGGLHRLADRAEEVGREGIELDLLAEAGAERLERALRVVAAAVEASVDERLHARAQRAGTAPRRASVDAAIARFEPPANDENSACPASTRPT